MGNPSPPLKLMFLFSLSLSISSYSSLPLRHTFSSSLPPPKATASDLLSLLGPKDQASKINSREAQRLKSCLKFLVPFSPNSSHNGRGRRSMVGIGGGGRKEGVQDELIWWPPQSVLDLARLAVDSGGDPGAVHRTLDPTVLPMKPDYVIRETATVELDVPKKQPPREFVIRETATVELDVPKRQPPPLPEFVIRETASVEFGFPKTQRVRRNKGYREIHNQSEIEELMYAQHQKLPSDDEDDSRELNTKVQSKIETPKEASSNPRVRKRKPSRKKSSTALFCLGCTNVLLFCVLACFLACLIVLWLIYRDGSSPSVRFT